MRFVYADDIIYTEKMEEGRIINSHYILNTLKKKILKNKILIIAIILMIYGLSALIINLRWIIGFGFSHKLSDIDKHSIESGMCIKDSLKYTYGNVATEISTNTSNIYLIDIGSHNDNYILIRKYQSSFYGETTELDSLQRIRSVEQRPADAESGIKIYGIVKHSELLKSSSGLEEKDISNALGISTDEVKQKLSSAYEIEIVSPDKFIKGIVTGVCLILSAVAIALFVRWKDKKMVDDVTVVTFADDKAEQTVNKEDILAKPKDSGIFNKESLRHNNICSIMIENESLHCEIEDSNIIKRIEEIIDTALCIDSTSWEHAKSIYMLKVMFDDCTFMQIDYKEDSIISYLNEYRQMDSVHNDELIKIIKKEISNNEKKL